MMVRALVWKEWREQRAVVLAGLLLAVALPPFLLAGMSLMGSRVDVTGLAQALPVVYAGLLWPLFAAAAGAGTIAAEVGNGTLGFLLSRPASVLATVFDLWRRLTANSESRAAVYFLFMNFHIPLTIALPMRHGRKCCDANSDQKDRAGRSRFLLNRKSNCL